MKRLLLKIAVALAWLQGCASAPELAEQPLPKPRQSSLEIARCEPGAEYRVQYDPAPYYALPTTWRCEATGLQLPGWDNIWDGWYQQGAYLVEVLSTYEDGSPEHIRIDALEEDWAHYVLVRKTVSGDKVGWP